MTDNLDRIAQITCSKLNILGYNSPSFVIVRRLIEIAFFASIKTEESQFVKGSVTFCNPQIPDRDIPPRRRADYPAFTSFGKMTVLSSSKLVKLSRAVDSWTGSIAVFGHSASKLIVWGILDQQVNRNKSLHQEGDHGYSTPGILTIKIESVGDVSVYHGNLFIARLKQNQIIEKEADIFGSQFLFDRIRPALELHGSQIASFITSDRDLILNHLMDEWSSVVARICIGLRRLGTGGSLLITPTPNRKKLDIINQFPYHRLRDATILKVLDSEYRRTLYKKSVSSVGLLQELRHAEADEEDRTDELTGAVKIVTSLAAIDGLVLLNPELDVIGFGVKIKASNPAGVIFDGQSLILDKGKPKKVDVSELGTRHSSMFRYCAADENAIGFVISQDGNVRLVASLRGKLALWDNVKLLKYQDDAIKYAKGIRHMRRMRKKKVMPSILGYSKAPKTLAALSSFNREK